MWQLCAVHCFIWLLRFFGIYTWHYWCVSDTEEHGDGSCPRKWWEHISASVSWDHTRTDCLWVKYLLKHSLWLTLEWDQCLKIWTLVAWLFQYSSIGYAEFDNYWLCKSVCLWSQVLNAEFEGSWKVSSVLLSMFFWSQEFRMHILVIVVE